MSVVDVQHPLDPKQFTTNIHDANWRGDSEEDDIVVGIVELYADIGMRRHIRDPRMGIKTRAG